MEIKTVTLWNRDKKVVVNADDNELIKIFRAMGYKPEAEAEEEKAPVVEKVEEEEAKAEKPKPAPKKRPGRPSTKKSD